MCPTRKQWVVLFGLFLFETMIWQQFMLAFVFIASGVVRGIYRYFRADRDLRHRYVLPVAHLAAGLACFGLFWFNVHVWSPIMAKRIGDACNEYRQDNSRYPMELDELTPEYLTVIPPAKLTVAWNDFSYSRFDEDSPSLSWVVIPPFGWSFYTIADEKFGFRG
jgi:hypothetical protein